ncbi:MAG TPA: helix-turn-helix domain-containing protein [Dysgonomonas sp.]|uniref:helix-turn-helix domain-containing protein n=1 Tax=unclassified Dysgonomonas TaxID=2630389 RepID=UPI0025BD2500|nr:MULTISPECIES: helix-turn-helix domain-containing protein [unclassified Dysgonomonas]HML66115.1 helix-turn-helix domain-containing protein [Dysgonomonas sp.]
MENSGSFEEMFNELKNMLKKRFDKIDDKLERMANIKNCLDGDELIDNQDLCLLLKVTKRTLQRYRDLNMIPFYKIDGRMYYKKSEVMGIFRNRIEPGGKSSDKK